MVSESTAAQHHISLNMPGVLLQNDSTQAAVSSNAAPDKPPSTITTARPKLASPEGPTAVAAPAVPGDATATAVENMPTVGAANLPFHTPLPTCQLPTRKQATVQEQ